MQFHTEVFFDFGMEQFLAEWRAVEVNIEFYLTNVCNMRCVFCGAWKQNEAAGYLPVQKIHEILNSTASRGLKYITLSGGEPLAYKNLLDVINYANSLGLYINISTNGLLIDHGILEHLAYKNINIRVSLHTLKRELHEKITGTDTLEKVLLNIGLLRERHAYFSIGATMFEDNIDEIGDLAQFALDSGAAFIRFTPVFSVYKGQSISLNRDFYEVMLTKIVASAIQYKKYLDYTKKKNIFLNDYIDILATRRCAAASELYIAINPDLNVVPCPVLPHYSGLPFGLYKSVDDIKSLQDSYDSIFSNGFIKKLKGECQSCAFKAICVGGCLSLKLANQLQLTDEQPICLRTILKRVMQKFGKNDVEDILHYWQYHNNKRTSSKEANKSCIRRLPIWELNYKFRVPVS